MTQPDALPEGLLLLRKLSPFSSGTCHALVRTATGHDRLWTRWLTAAHVTRAVAAAALTREVPSVPRLLESNEAECWTLHESPQGVQLGDVLLAQGALRLQDLADSPRTTLLQSLGLRLAKLHSVALPEHCVGEIPGPQEAPATRSLHSHLARWLGQQEDHHKALRLEAMALRHELRAFHPGAPCVLTHGALGVWSMWVDQETMEVVGLSGWGEARVLPLAAEFASLVGVDQVFCALEQRDLRRLYGSYGVARTMDMERQERFFGRVVRMEMLRGLRGRPEGVATADLMAQVEHRHLEGSGQNESN